MINLTPGYIFAWGTGIMILILGVLVLATSRANANKAFMVWAVGMGGQALWSNTQFETPRMFAPDFWWVFAALNLVAAIGTIMLATSRLVGIQGFTKRQLGMATLGPALCFVGFAVSAIFHQSVGPGLNISNTDQTWSYMVYTMAYGLAIASPAWFACLAAVKARAARENAPVLSALSIAFLVWPSIFIAMWLNTPFPLYGWALLALCLYCGIFWLATSSQQGQRYARNVAVVPVAITLVAYLASLAGNDALAVVNNGFFGAGRLVTGGLIAFAVVRHQILGFDVKVRRGIKGSTLAALFFAVFFVVSETTAEVLGGTRAGPFVGILVAGGLVFFLAPLQRWADRVAGAATGDAKPIEVQSDAEKERTYLQMAKAAWADGNLSRDERRMLDQLAVSLSLSAESTKRLEAEASG